MKKYQKICMKWQILVLNSEKNFRFSSIFFKIHNFGTHIFLYVYTTHTQLPHMSYSGFQIHNTCYTHVKSCVYMCCVQGSTLVWTMCYKLVSCFTLSRFSVTPRQFISERLENLISHKSLSTNEQSYRNHGLLQMKC